jgi:hypothetical protein
LRTDAIEAVGIDEQGSLWVKPAKSTFPYIYREAMEVHWDHGRRCLFSPVPREWSYGRWFQQIVAAAREQGVSLEATPTTVWSNINGELRSELMSCGQEANSKWDT